MKRIAQIVRDPETGDIFHSKGELNRWHELKLLEKAGEISDLQRQVRFPLHSFHGPVKIRSPRYKEGRVVTYVPDFVYKDIKGVRIVEDYKGFWTAEAKLKIAFFEAMEGTRVQLTGPQKMRKRRRAA